MSEGKERRDRGRRNLAFSQDDGFRVSIPWETRTAGAVEIMTGFVDIVFAEYGSYE